MNSVNLAENIELTICFFVGRYNFCVLLIEIVKYLYSHTIFFLLTSIFCWQFARYENALTYVESCVCVCVCQTLFGKGFIETKSMIEPLYNPIYQHTRLMVDMGIGFFFLREFPIWRRNDSIQP